MRSVRKNQRSEKTHLLQILEGTMAGQQPLLARLATVATLILFVERLCLNSTANMFVCCILKHRGTEATLHGPTAGTSQQTRRMAAEKTAQTKSLYFLP
jgi:hypothetical protein